MHLYNFLPLFIILLACGLALFDKRLEQFHLCQRNWCWHSLTANCRPSNAMADVSAELWQMALCSLVKPPTRRQVRLELNLS